MTTNFILGASLNTGSATFQDQTKAIRRLDSAGIDFITIDDYSSADASIISSFLSSQTRQIGLIPTIATTHTEPFHIATATATLDYTARSRAGWAAAPSLTSEEAAAWGRREVATAEDAWQETVAVTHVVRALWDSWEDDAEIRDARSGRFLDRDKLHYIDAVLTDSVGEPYSIKGPSIVPRPPQGNPPIFITAYDDASRAAALATADVIVVPGDNVPEVLSSIALLRAEARDHVAIIPSLQVPSSGLAPWLAATTQELIDAAIAGLHLRFSDLNSDVEAVVKEVVDSNGKYGESRQGLSLRARFGLPSALNQFVSS